jgi:excisionase family DNA binding protein
MAVLERVSGRGVALGGELFSVPQVARILACSRPTVYNRIRSGELAAFRIGSAAHSHWRVRRGDLEAFLAAANGVGVEAE